MRRLANHNTHPSDVPPEESTAEVSTALLLAMEHDERGWKHHLLRCVAASFHVVKSSILPIMGIGLAQRVDQFTRTRSLSLQAMARRDADNALTGGVSTCG
jgi:hypothetical protein